MREFAAREIGARIAQARKEAGAMTQEELADALNVSKRSVQDYEAGTTIPWKHFQRLEEIFHRSLHWFLHGEEDTTAIRRPAEAPTEGEILERLVAVEAGQVRTEELLAELLRRLPGEQDEPQEGSAG